MTSVKPVENAPKRKKISYTDEMARKAKQEQPQQGGEPAHLPAILDAVAQPAPKLRRQRGRPVFPWTEELENFILEGAISNLSLGQIIIEGQREFPEGFPCAATIKAYATANQDFSARYARAKDMSQDWMAEEIIDIIDGRHVDFRLADLDERKASVEERKWVMGKLRRKKWGEVKTTEITGADGAPLVQPQVLDTRSLSPDAQAALYQALQIVAAQNEAEDAEYTEEDQDDA